MTTDSTDIRAEADRILRSGLRSILDRHGVVHTAVRLHHCFALRIRADSHESRVAYDKAIELGGHIAETAYLTRRRDQLG